MGAQVAKGRILLLEGRNGFARGVKVRAVPQASPVVRSVVDGEGEG